jgi:pimeloyl-ACP methyl ester carboxylesterase
MRLFLLSGLFLGIALLPAHTFAESKSFNSNGVRIHYVDEGAGEPVVLVHGYTNYVERNWIETGVLPNLAKNYRVIALDLRGHGESGKPHDPKAYGAELGLDVVRLLDHLKITRAHLVGYSLGGVIAAKLLTTNANRFITATLVAASGRRSWTAESQRNAEAAAVELEGGVPYRSLILATAPSDLPPPTEEAIRKASQELVAHNDPLAHAALTRAGREFLVTDSQMAAVQVPTLAIVGTADPAAAGVKSLKARWPALETVFVEGATHWGDRGILVRPEFTTSLRQFLAAHRQASTKSRPAA